MLTDTLKELVQTLTHPQHQLLRKFLQELQDERPLRPELRRCLEQLVVDRPKLRVHSLDQTCGASPVQWNATTEDGRYVFIHYRYGYLSVKVGGRDWFGRSLDEEAEGCISFERVEELTGLEYFHKEDQTTYD